MRAKIMLRSFGALFLLLISTCAGSAFAGDVLGISGLPSRSGGAPLSTAAEVTTAAMTLYVDPTGDDAGACTATGTDACLTIQGALDKIPNTIHHAVVVNVAAGTYSGGGVLTPFRFTAPTQGDGSLDIIGATANITPATGTATGTITANTVGSNTTTTWGTVTDSGQAWTVDDLRGHFLQTQTGVLFPISSNTATVITLVGAGGAAFGISDGNTYSIVDPATVLDGLSQPAFINGQHGHDGTMINLSNFKHADENFTFLEEWGGGTFVYASLFDPGVAINIAQIRVLSSATTLSLRTSVFRSRVGGPAIPSVYATAAATSGADLSIDVQQCAFYVDDNDATAFRLDGASAKVHGSDFRTATTSAAVRIKGSFLNDFRGDKFTYTGAGSGMAIRLGSSSPDSYVQSHVLVGGSLFTGFSGGAVPAIRVEGMSQFESGGSNTISSNFAGIWAFHGARILVASSDTFSGNTNDLTVDGATYTIAVLRALVPKSITDLSTTSRVWEN